jgi:hypothetical protein
MPGGQERRREGQKNVLRVVSREWLSWLRIGCKKFTPRLTEKKRRRGLSAAKTYQ